MPARWAVEFIRRSRTARLAVVLSCELEDEYSRVSIPSLAGAMDNIGLLICKKLPVDYGVDASLPALAHLVIDKCSEEAYKGWKPQVQLRLLTMIHSYLSMDLFSQSLTPLRLRVRSEDLLPGFDYHQFMSTLSTLTKLQSLRLGLSSLTSTAIESPPYLLFPSLLDLKLRGTEEECLQFFTHNSCPSLIRLDMTLCFNSTEPTDNTLQRSAYSALWSNTSILSLGSLSRISIHRPASRTLEIRAFLHVLPVVVQPTVRILCIYENDVWTALGPGYLDTLRHFPLSELQHFQISLWGRHARGLALESLPTNLLSSPIVRLVASAPVFSAVVDLTPTCRCNQAFNQRTFNRDAQPENNRILYDRLSACGHCQDFAAAFFPALRTVRVEVHLADIEHSDAFPIRKHALSKFLAHRSDCGRPLERVAFRYLEVEKTKKVRELEGQLRAIGNAVNWIDWELRGR
ncbi:hypothetical protein AX16_002130 [Volvariella volvacea WC 439]|nr:hypothetical protein AX16_002130 [Volvariella volvacea WC 439]